MCTIQTFQQKQHFPERRRKKKQKNEEENKKQRKEKCTFHFLNNNNNNLLCIEVLRVWDQLLDYIMRTARCKYSQ